MFSMVSWRATQDRFLSLRLAWHKVELATVEPRAAPHSRAAFRSLRSPPRAKTSRAQTTKRKAAGGELTAITSANLFDRRRVRHRSNDGTLRASLLTQQSVKMTVHRIDSSHDLARVVYAEQIGAGRTGIVDGVKPAAMS